jgi:hypothetical protein
MARMGHLARKRRLRQPVITEEEMADYLALAENFENHAQWVSARRGTLKRPLRATVAWVVATSAILGLLTAMLIVGDLDRGLMLLCGQSNRCQSSLCPELKWGDHKKGATCSGLPRPAAARLPAWQSRSGLYVRNRPPRSPIMDRRYVFRSDAMR